LEGKEVAVMTGLGWEFWGLKFSWLLIMLVSAVLFVVVWLQSHGSAQMAHVDGMAGDEGED
jgi:hypothetical protein